MHCYSCCAASVCLVTMLHWTHPGYLAQLPPRMFGQEEELVLANDPVEHAEKAGAASPGCLFGGWVVLLVVQGGAAGFGCVALFMP